MKKHLIGCIILGALILSGCNVGESDEKQLSEILSKMYIAEQEYRDSQSEISNLEKSEQKLFTEVMELTQSQPEELVTKVTELKELLNERMSHIKEEETSMKKAQELVESISELTKTVNEENENAMNELKEATTNRYDLHSSFVTEYKKLLDSQDSLYEMLANKETELAELQEKVEEVNSGNETVKSAIGTFNDSTQLVNELKDILFAKND